MGRCLGRIVCVCATLLTSRPALAQFMQEGGKLVGTGAVGQALQGYSVSLSADGNTALVGGRNDNGLAGAAWVWTRSGGVWTQEGLKLVGSGAVGEASQGLSVSLSADGNTALVGGNADNSYAGAAWVWTRVSTRHGSIWSQQGPKLVGSGAVGGAYQGTSVSLSADGNTAVVGGFFDNNGEGAAWVWTRTGSTWSQQGPKLVGSGSVGHASQGSSVAVSADGNTVIIGGPEDHYLSASSRSAGAAWVWTRSGGVWTQQGPKLVGSGAVGAASQGVSVSLSANGDTAIVGGPNDNVDSATFRSLGAAWVWTRSGGVWTLQGPKLVGSGGVAGPRQGHSVSLSADGNTAIVGGPSDNYDAASITAAGAAWIWTRSGGVWIQQGSKMFGSGAVGPARQGLSVSVSGDGHTAIVGGPYDNFDPGASAGAGAAWIFTGAPAVVSPAVFPLADIDGDGKADLVVWRASTGTWYWLISSSGYDYASQGQKQWGSQSLGDVALTGDIDGDSKADLVVWRASTGTWYWLTSANGYSYAAQGQKQWGATGDIPLLADIDGDHKADLVVWRASTGTWYWLTSMGGYNYATAGTKPWGNAGLGDKPVLGDLDGDGKADLAVWRASTGTWYWLTSVSGYNYASQGQKAWGDQSLGDVPLLGDFDGDQRSDLTVWRASTGTWYWLTSLSGYAYASQGQKQWGNQSLGDVPLLGEMDSDGKADLVVWRASNGTWYWLTSSSGYDYATAGHKQWGASDDRPMIR